MPAGGWGKPGAREHGYQRVHVEGTRIVLEAALALPHRPRVLHVSSLGVLGPVSGTPAAEDAPYGPTICTSGASGFNGNPQSLKGERILLTTNSTGDYAVRSCLKKFGVAFGDVQFVNLGQAQIISAFISNNSDVVGVWAPNNYTLEEKASAKTLCTGADAGAIIPGALVVRADYAKENPRNVAAYLATYLRGWSWAKANPKAAHDMTKTFYAQGGVDISDQAIDKEFALRPVFLLDQQLKIMDRSTGASKVDQWFTEIGKFMVSVGTLPEAPDAKSYITDDYMKMVASDPKLKAFATEFDNKSN